jgi:phosphoserine phosphatase
MRFMEDLVEKERMERELAVARRIQMRVLPRKMPEVTGYDVSGWCRPADETGGDIFDVIELPDGRLVLLLGDATGHGIGPALSVTQVRAMLRMCVRLDADLDDAIRHINDQLSDDLASNRFVTAFLGVLDPESHRLRYHSGGQAPILHFHATSGEPEWLRSSTQPLGIMAGLPIGEAQALDLAPGDIVALITDGIYEFEDPSHEQFGRDRLAEVIRRHQDEPMAGLIERIVEGTESFARGAPQNDDMTILLVRRLP